jgi:hypothetical protein
LKKLFSIAVVLFLASGCASKSKFVYEPPKGGLENDKGRLVAAVVHIVDQRTDAAKFDILYEGKPAEDIQTMLEYELIRTDLFKAVIPVNYPAVKADFIIEPTLHKLQGQVPDLDTIRLKSVILSCVSIIGSSIYNLTNTEVYGESGIHLRITDGTTGKIILDKSYSGLYKQDVSKFMCNIPETKVMVAQKSIQNAIETIKSDINQVIGNKGKDILPLAWQPRGRLIQENSLKDIGAIGLVDQSCGNQVMHGYSDLLGINTFVLAKNSVNPCFSAPNINQASWN